MTEKNRIWMGLDGKRIEIKITATSVEQANRMYQAIELALIHAVRIDMEDEWQRDNEGGDRDG